jgi:hypothetical protein
MNLLKKIKAKIKEVKTRKEENKAIKQDYLFNKTKLIMINDLIDDYRKNNKNVYTVMRDITNLVKGW